MSKQESKESMRSLYRDWMVSILKRMVNRPETISSVNALLWGVAWLIIGAIVAWYFKFVPTSMIGYTTSGYVPLVWHVAIMFVMWVSFGVVYFAFGVMRNRQAGVIDLFGRMLYAHWPVTLLLVPGMIMNRVAYATFMSDASVAFKLYPLQSVVMAIFVVVILLWALYWGYLAFRRATERGGIFTLVCYIIATPLAAYLSQMVLEALRRGMSW